MKKQLNLNTTHAHNNYKSLCRYTKQLLSLYPHLVIIKANIYYNLCAIEQINYPLPVNNITYEEAKTHREQFFKQIKKQAFGKYLVGYAWKMDHNNHKGYFNDLLLFFDCTIMPTSILNNLGHLLSDYWHTTISKRLGWGTFKIIKTMADVDNNQELDTIITSMTLLDEYIRFVAPHQQDRTFDRGRISPKKIATLTEQAKEQANHWQDL